MSQVRNIYKTTHLNIESKCKYINKKIVVLSLVKNKSGLVEFHDPISPDEIRHSRDLS
jgi:hypothetical protein